MSIFKQLQHLRDSRKDQLSENEVRHIANLSNDKTWADEAKIVLTAIIWIAAAYCGYSGFLFYRTTFSNTFSPIIALLAAVGIATVVELVKIRLGLRVLRAAFFQWATESWFSLGYWAVIGALALGGFIWSYNISTSGMKILADKLQHEATKGPGAEKINNSATADIDKQIADLQRQHAEAMNTKWHGITTVYAQGIAKNISASITTLQAQRAAVLNQSIAEYGKSEMQNETQISTFSAFIRDYGGVFEIATAICMFAVVFYERRLVELYQDGRYQPPTSHKIPKQILNDPAAYNAYKTPHGNPVSNSATGQIYFNRSRDTGQVSAAQSALFVPPPVAQCGTDSATKTLIGSDAILNDAMNRIRRDTANLRNENGTASTVCNRIIGILTDINQNQITMPEFKPSPEVAEKAMLVFKDAQGAILQYGKINLKMDTTFAALNAAMPQQPVEA